MLTLEASLTVGKKIISAPMSDRLPLLLTNMPPKCGLLFLAHNKPSINDISHIFVAIKTQKAQQICFGLGRS